MNSGRTIAAVAFLPIFLVSFHTSAGSDATSSQIPDWKIQVERFLSVTDAELEALRVAERCVRAVNDEVLRRKYSFPNPYRDVVMSWARAMADGNIELATAEHSVIVGRRAQSRSILAQLERLKPTEDEKYQMFDDYVAECRLIGIEARSDSS